MPYTIVHDDKKNCIRIKVEGELNLDLLQKFAAEVSKQIRQTGCSCILNDLREAKVTGEFFDVYRMPFSAKDSGIEPTCKRALVVGDRISDFYFLETVFLNQGHLVKMFRTIEEAETWLFEEKG